jgi:hypothetical protein
MLLSYTGARCCGTVPFRRERRPHLGFRPEQIIQIPAISPAALLEEKTMLWTIIAILVVLWLLGLIGQIGGSLIHLLLVIAAVALIFQMISGRRAAV